MSEPTQAHREKAREIIGRCDWPSLCGKDGQPLCGACLKMEPCARALADAEERGDRDRWRLLEEIQREYPQTGVASGLTTAVRILMNMVDDTQTSYRAGAEAMREKAAQVADRELAIRGYSWGEVIRTLPLPTPEEQP